MSVKRDGLGASSVSEARSTRPALAPREVVHILQQISRYGKETPRVLIVLEWS